MKINFQKIDPNSMVILYYFDLFFSLNHVIVIYFIPNRNDYTCHQCRYNTNCSNSFEYHLHGHLVSKRQALWNKVIKIKTEEYRCPCGFYINSTRDNNQNADTGNKVAAHLMKCEYKYCKVDIGEDDNEFKTESLK